MAKQLIDNKGMVLHNESARACKKTSEEWLKPRGPLQEVEKWVLGEATLHQGAQDGMQWED